MSLGDESGVFLARPKEPRPGIRLAVKDLFDTADLVTTYGSSIFAEHRPVSSAEVVVRLEAAGYANVGKTNLHEFAYGVTSENPHFGTVPNPIAPGRIAGGSSGGSAAAVAAGLADGALGSDSGGSVRIPAACCGIVGFKPTYGLVPLDGCFPLAPSFDHAGPMARTVGACSAMLAAVVPGFAPTTISALDDARVGVAWIAGADPLVAERVLAAAALFRHAVELDVPLPKGIGAVFEREVADVHRELFEEHAESYGDEVRRKIERCLAVTDREYEAAVRTRDEYRERFAEAVAEVDLLVTPTLGCVAPPLERTGGSDALRDELILRTYPINAVGWPALALPCGVAEDGLPASVQLVGRPAADALVLAVGEALERALAAVP